LFTMEGRREWSPVVVVEWSGDGTRAGERVHGLLERLITLELSGTRAIRFTGGPRTTTDRTKIDVIDIIRIGIGIFRKPPMYYLASSIWHQSRRCRPRQARPGVVRQEGVIGISTCHPCSCACASLTRESENHQSDCGSRGPDQTLFCTCYRITNPSSTLESWLLSWTRSIYFSQKGSPVFLLFQDHDTFLVFSFHQFISNNVVPIRNY